MQISPFGTTSSGGPRATAGLRRVQPGEHGVSRCRRPPVLSDYFQPTNTSNARLSPLLQDSFPAPAFQGTLKAAGAGTEIEIETEIEHWSGTELDMEIEQTSAGLPLQR